MRMKVNPAQSQWETSSQYLARAERSLTGGVSSPFRRMAPVPLYFRDGSGCRLEDVDGHCYIDYGLAWGPLILGHRHPALVEALRIQADRPHDYGAQHELEFRVSEKIQEMVPCARRVAFTCSGTEAVQLALRLARAFVDRNLVVKFEGHYHGWMDSVLVSYHPQLEEMGPVTRPNTVPASRGQVPGVLSDVLVCPWNRPEALSDLFERNQGKIAAVIMEPVLCNSGCLLPRDGYLQAVRDLCTDHGAVLIFDEVITGFRMAPGGAQSYYGIKPDLAILGKALAGGLPVSAVVGRRELMEQLCDGGVAFGGTFNGNPISLAAADVTLTELEKENGRLLVQAHAMGSRLKEGLLERARKWQIPLQITGFDTAFGLHFGNPGKLFDYRDTLADDTVLSSRFVKLALEEGIYLLPEGRWYVSTVHREADIEETLQALERVFERLKIPDSA